MRRSNRRSGTCHRSPRRLFFEPLEDRRLLTTVMFGTPSVNATESNSNLQEPIQRDTNTGTITVNVEYSGLAINGVDFTSVASINIPDTQYSANLTIPLLDDAPLHPHDGDKTLKIKILPGTGYTVGSVDEITVLIEDPDAPPTTTIHRDEVLPCDCPCTCPEPPTGIVAGVNPASGGFWGGKGG